MSKKIFWLLIIIIISVAAYFLFIEKNKEEPTSDLNESLLAKAAEETGVSFMENFIAIAPSSDDSAARSEILKTLSKDALNEIDEDDLSKDLALFVGVQDVPDEGVEVQEVKITEADSKAVVIIKMNYSGSSEEREINLVAEEGQWKVDSVSSPELNFDFSEKGRIVINNPGYPEGVWHLLYEKPGAPALSEALLFDEESICLEEEESVCDPSSLESGLMVSVKGLQKDEGVLVRELKYIEN
ncbi:MAG: hypothetical protein ACLFNR_01020 [Candidatus Paceibacterota bacterium]